MAPPQKRQRSLAISSSSNKIAPDPYLRIDNFRRSCNCCRSLNTYLDLCLPSSNVFDCGSGPTGGIRNSSNTSSLNLIFFPIDHFGHGPVSLLGRTI